MERLTSYKNECDREMICRYEECDVSEEYCPHLQEDNCICLQDVISRLAAYEDLGVTPEQIREMDKAYLEKCEEVKRLRAELEEYGQMEHALMEMYGEGANLKVFVKLLIGAMAAKQKIEAAGGKIEKMIILTNETADEWEAYKKLREKCEEEKKHGA